MQALVLPLRDLDRASLPEAGGKAANLGDLLRAGLPVPDGFCVTTAAYRRAVDAAGIAPRLSALLATLNVEAPERLAAVGAAARDLLLNAPVPEEVGDALLAAARPLAGEPMAVRSSATAEDLPEASFAGQQDTYLNVVGENALLEAVRRCWASLWTDRAIAYRQRNGIPHESVALGVVVQRMVAAEAAGVLFTANPVSGKRTEVVIDASLGLGEAVVSGLVSPDHYVVDRSALKITVRQIGSKSLQVVGTAGGGTARVTTEAAASQAQALPDPVILDLTRLGIRIEEHFGWPQDVEWAKAGGKLYILQSRPITSLYPAPPPAPDGSLRIYISINSAQGMLEPFTPMGASIFTFGVRTIVYGSRSGPIFLVELGNRLYADVSALLRNRLGRQVLSEMLPQLEPVIARILARLQEDPRLAPAASSARASALGFVRRYPRNVFLVARRIVATVASPARARRRVDEVVVPWVAGLRARLQRPISPGGEPEALRAVLRGLPNLLLNLGPVIPAAVLLPRQVEARVRAWGLDVSLVTVARQGLPHNRTTMMDLDLWALARRLKADALSREALVSETPPSLAARYHEGSLPPIAQEGMAAFLSRYGHRAIREIDVGMPRWADDPSYLFGVLRNYLAHEDPETAPDRHFVRQVAAGEQAVRDLVAAARRLPGGWYKAPLLAFVLGRYRQLGGLREAPKFLLMWLFQAIRQMLLRSGAGLVDRGLLDRPEDVFFLRIEELATLGKDGAQDAAPGGARGVPEGASLPSAPEGKMGVGMGSPRPDLRSLVALRRREYGRELARPRAPRVLTSEGEAFYGEALAPQEGMLSGSGVSPGIARGRARIIRDPLGAHLEPGEILVAPSTDPAWTPLFLTAGGLVMEAGGMMSHGSIVAREYGIPAVVGVAEATTRIITGQVVEVDGHQGLIDLTP